MEFENNSCRLRKLICGTPLYFVIVDLKAGKDTVVILKELNSCFPFAQNDTQLLMHKYVNDSKVLVQQAGYHFFIVHLYIHTCIYLHAYIHAYIYQYIYLVKSRR